MGNIALQRITQAVLTNKSGGAVAKGDVVIIDSSTASSFTTTTTSGFVNGVVGVIVEPNGIASNASGMVAFCGPVPQVNLSGSASLADLIKTHTVAKQAVRHAAGIVVGDFGIVLGTGTSPAALLWGLPAGATGAGTGDFNGPGSATDGHLVVFDGTTGKQGKDGGAPSGLVLLASATPSGTGTVSFTSISAAYKRLIVKYMARGTQVATNTLMDVYVNNDTTAANYRDSLVQSYGTGAVGGFGGDTTDLGSSIAAASSPTNSCTVGTVEIPFYANTTFNKHLMHWQAQRRDASSIQEVNTLCVAEWENAAAINRVDFILASGNYAAGSEFLLYAEN